MSETLTEMEGCDLLARLFSRRGYSIRRNVAFREYGVEFHVDGWDAAARVGFEFLTSEDEDHDDLTLEEYQTLTAAQRRGELALFVIDEVEPLSAESLAAEAHEFLDEVADAAHARLQAAKRRPRAASKRSKAGGAAAKAAATRVTAVTKATKATKKKAATKKAATKKAATKKAATKKAATKKAATKKAATAATKRASATKKTAKAVTAGASAGRTVRAAGGAKRKPRRGRR